MKKIYNLLLLVLLASVFTGCKYEVEDVFEKSSAERVAAAIEDDMQILTSAPNGWLMEYYGDTQYGGYNMICQFAKDGKVTVFSEVYEDKVETSTYRLMQSQGVVLSFDTYNDNFHFFSDPANPVGIGENGKGMLGDFEFRVMEASKDRVVLKGKKHDANIVMTPVPDGLNIPEFFKSIIALENELTYSQYALAIGDKTYTTKCSYRQFSVTDAETGDVTKMPFIITGKTLKFYKPVTLGDATLNEFSYDGEVWHEVSNPAITITPIIPPLSSLLPTSALFFNGQATGTVATGLQYAVAGSASEGEEIVMMFLGPASEINNYQNRGYKSDYSLTFISGAYAGALAIKLSAISDKQVKLAYTGSYQGDGMYYFKNCAYDAVIAALCGSNGKVWNLSSDNDKAPTVITFTEDGNPANTFTLANKLVIYPFR